MLLSMNELAGAVGGVLHGESRSCDGVAIDSRSVRGGELFVSLVAERDGHDFVADALAAGAAGWLGSRRVHADGSWIEVADTAAALLDIGRLARGHLPERVVAVTGSVAKTSVKDLAAAALGTTWRTHASERSFNNELGVPITLANAVDGTEAVVVEMGARGRGHIDLLCDVARPTVGLVTVVALAHAEMFGAIEDVAAAKGELIAALPTTGTAVLNADDPLVAGMASRSVARVLRFGLDPSADVVAEDVVLDDELRPSFRLRSPWGDATLQLAVRGAHQVSNALAAASAALACDVTVERVAAGLRDAELSPWRMAFERTASGAIVLNDAYNANPTSVTAALHALAALPARRRVAVLGLMAELGDHGPREHARIADLAAELGITLVAVDCGDYGVEPVAGIDGALAALGDLAADEAVLVKGSRVAGLERLAQRLVSD